MLCRTLLAPLLVLVAVGACDSGHKAPSKERRAPITETRPAEPDLYTTLRNEMVTDTIETRGVHDPKVIAAMRLVPRHAFVPPQVRDRAYEDHAVPIGFDKTISQPYIVAMMTAAAHVKAGDKVLEIGTGSGYQAAVLAMMGAKVFTIEIHDQLATRTKEVLKKSGFSQVKLRTADGYYGWPEEAPFDAIIITCATPEIPPALLEQLKTGGRVVVPLGEAEQTIISVTKGADGDLRKEIVLDGVIFGPMIGEIENRADDL
ncbi:MAG TPA: protein-L-isoaspartate(D-aspartate) O-methyltransferase [Kofleriaceae bacterium]|nr:protein-L-isoaspartate(D-aspartate) O-methyltransferase [Kofleriaceae bacterium]